MSARTLTVALVIAGVTAATQVSARAPAPLVPTALVEDVKSTTADIEFMDYVGKGQVIKLGAGDTLVLSYLKSCEHETITGGTVVVGADESNVQDGQIVRTTVPCDGGKIRLSSPEASKSAATAFRLQSADIHPLLFARTPALKLPKLADDERTLVIVREGRHHERHEVKLDEAAAAAGYYDLSQANLSLAPGAIYDATIGDHMVSFQIDAKAKSGPAPIVSRLVRFQ
ncbi:MAG TPA: hypothetical protein VKW08_18330 [Xanthobacteraceae bacterium]|nr:hypothetical protein [Xanthobacteraceae bacterium]